MEEGKKPLSRSREEEEEEEEDEGKKARYGRCFSGLDLKLDRPLRELDPAKLKSEIRRWARAVARYARQLSRTLSGLSSSRHRSPSSSSSSFSSRHDDEASAAATSPSRK